MENGKDVEDGELENKDTAQDNLEQVVFPVASIQISEASLFDIRHSNDTL